MSNSEDNTNTTIENSNSGTDGTSSTIELTTSPSIATNNDDADNNVESFGRNDNNSTTSNSPTTTIRQRRMMTSTTSTNPDQLSTRWEQKANLDAIISQNTTLNSTASKAPMRTVSYELYDSKFWNARKTSIQNAVGTYVHQNKCILFLRSSIFGIGFVTASVGFFISWCCEKLSQFALVGVNVDMDKNVYGNYLGWSILFTLLAFIPIAFIRPVASGSGIAEAKAVLNGIKIPACTELLSAACKGISVIFAVASSLPVGLEGPLIFIG